MANRKGQFEKGWKGGPGRPKGTSMGDVLRDLLEEEIKDKKTGQKFSKKAALANIIYNQALGGDMQAAKLLISYTDGMPTQKFEGKLETTDLDTERLKDNVPEINREIARDIAEIEKLQRAAKAKPRKR